ncbi:MAG: NFACT family protein [Chloroflexi bacterium]|nr:NFACT family protein [Chloroflexota bacterium]
MNLDHFSLAALADVFRAQLLGSRLQRILAIDTWSIALELYHQGSRHHLLLSAEQQQPRALLLPDSLRRGLQQPQPLVQYMRRHLLGAQLQEIDQPAWERLLCFRFTDREREYSLWVEPMPRRANVLLVQGGIIRECLRRVGSAQNRYRQLFPGRAYQPPPPQSQKIPPWPIDRTDLAACLSQAGDRPLVRALSDRFLAISPLLARELCHRASLPERTAAGDVAAAILHPVLAELVSPLIAKQWQPGVAVQPADGAVLAYSVYPLTQYENWQPCADINEAMKRYYDAPRGIEVYDEAKRPLQQAIQKAQQALAQRRSAVESGIISESELKQLQQSGELILAYQYQIGAGQTQWAAPYDPGGQDLVIALDPTITPLQNAQSYFRRYQKAKRARAAGPGRLKKLSVEKALLDQLTIDLQLAENWPEIDEVRATLQSAGYLKSAQKQPIPPAKRGPRRFVSEGYVIWLGRNMRQNATLLNRHSHADDLWLHVRGGSGAHLIIRDDGRKIPESLVKKTASVAAYYSSLRHESSVPVDVTERRYVRPIKGAQPGLVRYRNERTIRVQPRDESILEAPSPS